MAADVSILAALIAGALSFLSPCVLPLVPPYLVYLTGASLERLADAEPEPRVRREVVFAALLFVLGFSTVFVALGAGASAIGGLLRVHAHTLAIVAGIAIIIMGLHFLGLTPIAWLNREKRADDPEAGRAVGRLRDGARVRVRLDPLHRPDPGGDPGGRGVRGDRRQGRRHARGLFGRASASRSSSRRSRSSRSPPSSPASARTSAPWRS